MECASYAESSVCRRKIPHALFRESFDTDNCGNCDNCLNPSVRIEASEELSAAIDCVLQIGSAIVRICGQYPYRKGPLMKSETMATTLLRFSVISAMPKKKSWAWWCGRGVISGYMSKDLENYGILKVTAKGDAVSVESR